MSDSDETVSPDSDETLPPEDDNDRCYSPDLFEDQVSCINKMKPMSMPGSVRKHHSAAHDISDSDSDSETDTKVHSSRNKVMGDKHVSPLKGGNRNNGHDKSQDHKTQEILQKDIKQDTEAQSERKQFMNEFLNMTESDSECEYEKNKKILDEMKKKSQRKNATVTKPELRGEGASEKKSKSFKNMEHFDTDHSLQKLHKKDWSKPSSKEETSSSYKNDSKKLSSFSKKSEIKEKSDSSTSSVKRKHSRSPVLQETEELCIAGTDILKDNVNAKKKKVPCQYGSKCYRKNPAHFEEYSHSKDETYTQASKKIKLDAISSLKVKPSTCFNSKVKTETVSSLYDKSPTTPKVMLDSCTSIKVPSALPSTAKVKVHSPTTDCKVKKRSRSPCKNLSTLERNLKVAQPYSFFLTRVSGIADKYNTTYALDITDILSEEMGSLIASCQFNYMFDIQWLMKQYPQQFRSKPLLIVHGEQGSSMTALQAQAIQYTNIRFCQAKLEMMYGTHHTKMMLLLYEEGLRIIIHTSNLIQQDWHQKTQGIWVSPLFPKLSEASKDKGDSVTHFKRDLIDYLLAYKTYQLKEWIDHIATHDMSSARVLIIASVPGRHIGDKAKSMWGHLKLRKVLQEHGPAQGTVKTWPVIGQFSSIGSLGPNKENWLCGEWQQSLSATKLGSGPQHQTKLQLIFPSRHNVRLSLEGYPAGGSLPYTTKTAMKQQYLHDFFHIWKSEGRGRNRAMPHIKSYTRPMQDGSKAAWFLVTSANLSKAAWGALEKKGVQLMIRSYEIGVLFLPKFFDEGEIFPITSDPETAAVTNKFLLPYDLPPTIYDKKDRPWMWDIPYMDLPDTNGNVWCPFSK